MRMRFMKKLIVMMFVLVIVSGGLFYWFQWRPSEIRKECVRVTIEDSKKEHWDAWLTNNRYRGCLVQNGLSPESLFVNTD